MKRTTTFIMMLAMAVMCVTASPREKQWVATWATAVQKVEPHNLPPAPGLSGNTLRQIIEVSTGGKNVRLQLSAQYDSQEVEIEQVELAEALTQGESADIKESSTVVLKWNGSTKTTMKPGEMLTSDPIRFRLKPRTRVAITIRFGKCGATDVSGHPGSRTTSYIATGWTNNFSEAKRMDHWCYISNLQVETSDEMAAIAVIGNSITDGRGTTTNHQNRWTDVLSKRLLKHKATRHLSVLNYGLGGNCVIRGGLGPTANSRFDRDALETPGVKYVIVFEGVNDIGGAWNADETAKNLIESYQKMIVKAHERGMKIFGATIMPFKGNGYYNDARERARNTVNEWIRTSGEYDGVIDFDRIMCDPTQTDRLNPNFLFENDWLHPNADGYRTMGEGIDLNLF
ncbi:MAG: SGNH/GDSL hydrolase family protein [Bacteroidaceae bacterium]|nr:SGNH/GDSL hydrolase family protein [Bacteroidaceae bacterium]